MQSFTCDKHFICDFLRAARFTCEQLSRHDNIFMIEVHHLRIIILCYLEIVWCSFGAVLVQFWCNFKLVNLVGLLKFIKFTKLQITIFSKLILMKLLI